MIDTSSTRPWQRDLLAVAGGALMPWAFAPFHWWWLGLASPLLLFLSWQGASAKRGLWRGYLFGLAMFGIGVSWVHVSMHRFGGVEVPLSVALTALFVAFLALFPATVGYLARRWFAPDPQRGGWIHLALVLPALWTLAEWVRGLIFTGFPWLNLGYAQIDGPLAGYGPVLGVYGISLLAVASAGLLLQTLAARRAWRYGLPAAALLFLGGWVLQQVEWTRAAGEPLRISLVQGAIGQDIKWNPEQQAPTLRLYGELTRKHWDSDVIIWPETAVPAFYHQVRGYLGRLAQEARMNDSELLIGVPVRERDSRRYFNSMISLGGREAMYHKVHLVPFGEFLPLKPLLGKFIDFFQIPMSDFSAGEPDQALLELGGHPVGISICYEDVFGEEVIRSLPQAAFLVNASNDAWFGDSIAPHQHLQIARMRALETGRYMLRATNTGVSAVIGPEGRVMATSPQFEAHVLTASIQPRTGATPYVRLGNFPVVILSLLALAVGYRLSRQK